MRIKSIFTILVVLLLFFSCKGKVVEKHDVVNIVRYDKVQYEYVEFGSFSALQQLQSEYWDMTKILVEDILEIGDINDSDINTKFKDYFRDSLLTKLNDDVEEKFNDISFLEKDLSKAFSSMCEYIPGIRVPVVYTQLSALNEAIVIGNGILGISLDTYMGSDYPLYKVCYYSYQRKTMNPDMIVPDCIFTYLQSEYPYSDFSNHDLCNIMLYYGIINYATMKILDRSLDEVMLYNEEQEKWCKENEKDILRYMIEKKHFYSTDFMVIRKYLKSAPYTSYFGKNSPDRVGLWLGTRIVEKYMKEHKDVTIKDLLETRNYYNIFVNSNYLK